MSKKYGFVFDLRRCIGCRTCVIACKVENNLEAGSWMKVLTNQGASTDLPAGAYPRLSLFWKPTPCMHCKNPPCLEACPSEGAIYRRPDGIVLIDREKCTGCGICVEACPYDTIQINPDGGYAGKCTLCCHRIDQGLEPFCARECICGAIRFGDFGDPESEVSRLVSRREILAVTDMKDTGPSHFYLTP